MEKNQSLNEIKDPGDIWEQHIALKIRQGSNWDLVSDYLDQLHVPAIMMGQPMSLVERILYLCEVVLEASENEDEI